MDYGSRKIISKSFASSSLDGPSAARDVQCPMDLGGLSEDVHVDVDRA